MSFKGNLLISALLHSAIIGAVAASGLRRAAPAKEEEKTIEIFFEVMEESYCASSQEMRPPPTPQESQDNPEILECPKNMDNQQNLENQASQECQESLALQHEPSAPPLSDTSAPAEEHAKVVTEAMAINRITPQYPRSARRKGHEGTVTVEASITPNGSISEAKIIASCGFAELDAAAISAVLSAKFAPATEDGVCINGRIRMTFDFRLK